MGFPSPATDYIEDSICLNRLFIPHPSSTSLVEFGGLQYVVDSSMAPANGSEIYYEIFGEIGIGKLMGKSIITPEGEALEGQVMEEVIVLGTVVLTITSHYDWNGPTI
ncbi:phage repressor protein [Erwinia aphidicola]|uniref:phage repressor protein n=1 Tax=Erwinia aphidicola TaxID=68334 RepID=UPI0020A03F53|nr:phage repressor protein [Erwinia aphidicola]MCP2232894.1 DNA polymerase V [Erwinia aphidicola]